MSHDITIQGEAEMVIGDVAYLARSRHRIPVLVALAERPRSRSELRELTDVSPSTIRRTLNGFEDRTWIRKDGHEYTATRLGEVVASAMERLIERFETERKLRHVWHWLPDEIRKFPAETWTDLTITVADPDVPYRPVARFESLLEETTTARFLRPEVALMEPCFDTLHGLIEDGLEVTVIDRPNCHAYFLSTYPVRAAELLQRDGFTALERDDLPPYGVGLLDERVVISCYGWESGGVKALVDTDAPIVREWALPVYESHVPDARPVEPPPTAGRPP